MNAVKEIDVVIDTKVYTVLYFYSEVNTTKTSTISNWVKRKTQLYIVFKSRIHPPSPLEKERRKRL